MKKKKPKLKRVKKRPQHLRQSKSEGFLDRMKDSVAMAEYFMNLRIMNPAAQIRKSLNEPRREGGFVRLAHAREEFTAPVITKGKSVQRRKRTSRRASRGRIDVKK